MIDGKNLYENMARLVSVPSVSGTEDEVKAAWELEAI